MRAVPFVGTASPLQGPKQKRRSDMTEAETTAPQPMPPTLNNLVPYVTVDGAMKAAEFYKAAFGAEIAFAVPPDDKGRTMHLHL
jgi:hypothetical protein